MGEMAEESCVSKKYVIKLPYIAHLDGTISEGVRQAPFTVSELIDIITKLKAGPDRLKSEREAFAVLLLKRRDEELELDVKECVELNPARQRILWDTRPHAKKHESYDVRKSWGFIS
jgi:hypothetical protein